MKIPPTATDRAFSRLCEINGDSKIQESKALRLAVLGGGCSGFQYEFSLVDTLEDGDILLERDGQRILIDEVSLPFLQGAVIDFSHELMGARFVVENPTATASCGCGTSFAI